ncbi:hypothetical protein [Streptomyces sp. NPDC007007]|uniref:hypothetical protein n=1 Tax=Streptomyces sp. NPDC007007 TaxID=3364770 RepID=UPI00368415D2
MKISSKRVVMGTVAAVALAGLGPVSASAATGNTPAASAATPVNGETLYEGLFFGQGPVAKAHPDLTLARGKTSSAESAEVADTVVDVIKAKDSTFFDRFGSEMQSGNEVRVNRILTEASQNTVGAMRSEYGAPAKAEDNLGAQCVVLVVVLGVGNVVYFVNAYESANVAYQVNWVDSVSPKAGDTISRERWVYQAAGELKV